MLYTSSTSSRTSAAVSAAEPLDFVQLPADRVPDLELELAASVTYGAVTRPAPALSQPSVPGPVLHPHQLSTSDTEEVVATAEPLDENEPHRASIVPS